MQHVTKLALHLLKYVTDIQAWLAEQWSVCLSVLPSLTHSLLHSFTPGSKPTFSTNPFHRRFLLPAGLPHDNETGPDLSRSSLWTPAQRYIHVIFCQCLFIYFFYGRLILRPWWTEVRESFTRGGPWVSLKKLLLGFFWSSLNYRVGQKVTKFRIFSDLARKLSALTPERGRIL